MMRVESMKLVLLALLLPCILVDGYALPQQKLPVDLVNEYSAKGRMPGQYALLLVARISNCNKCATIADRLLSKIDNNGVVFGGLGIIGERYIEAKEYADRIKGRIAVPLRNETLADLGVAIRGGAWMLYDSTNTLVSHGELLENKDVDYVLREIQKLHNRHGIELKETVKILERPGHPLINPRFGNEKNGLLVGGSGQTAFSIDTKDGNYKELFVINDSMFGDILFPYESLFDPSRKGRVPYKTSPTIEGLYYYNNTDTLFCLIDLPILRNFKMIHEKHPESKYAFWSMYMDRKDVVDAVRLLVFIKLNPFGIISVERIADTYLLDTKEYYDYSIEDMYYLGGSTFSVNSCLYVVNKQPPKDFVYDVPVFNIFNISNKRVNRYVKPDPVYIEKCLLRNFLNGHACKNVSGIFGAQILGDRVHNLATGTYALFKSSEYHNPMIEIPSTDTCEQTEIEVLNRYKRVKYTGIVLDAVDLSDTTFAIVADRMTAPGHRYLYLMLFAGGTPNYVGDAILPERIQGVKVHAYRPNMVANEIHLVTTEKEDYYIYILKLTPPYRR